MSDRTLALTLHLRCLVETVRVISEGIMDQAAGLSEDEIQERVEFLEGELERRMLAMSPPSPLYPNLPPNRLDPGDLPF